MSSCLTSGAVKANKICNAVTLVARGQDRNNRVVFKVEEEEAEDENTKLAIARLQCTLEKLRLHSRLNLI